jgi:ubiquitin-protein ligase
MNNPPLPTISSEKQDASGGAVSVEPASSVSVVIPKETIMRLLKDIRGVMSDKTLEDSGIMYRHSETDILTGFACIVGPSDTLYFGGYYYFMFKFPTNYPHSPPIISYLTNTNNIRFHPNFYANKNVCVSIINTWRGEQWTGCQSIQSILMTFQSLLDKEPLLHEPGIRSQHQDFKTYHTIVEYYNYNFACMRLLTDLPRFINLEPSLVPVFEEFMLGHFHKNKKAIREILVEKSKSVPDNSQFRISLYGGMPSTISYNSLLERFDASFTSSTTGINEKN